MNHPMKINKPTTNNALQLNELPGMVSAQWQRAQGGLFEIIKFGAMLMVVSNVLDGRSKRSLPRETAFNSGHGWNKGLGLKRWLSENCPDVNYKTALGYMAAAQVVAKAAELRADAPLLALMGEPGKKAAAMDEAARNRVMGIIAVSSLRALKAAGRLAERDSLPPTGEVRHEDGEDEKERRHERATELLTNAETGLRVFAKEGLHDAFPSTQLRLHLARMKEHLSTISRSLETNPHG